MSIRLALFLILTLDTLLLIFQIGELSISYNETLLLNGNFSFLQSLIKTSFYFFGQNDFALRLPMIILHILSAVLVYKISGKYLKISRNRVWLLLVFIFLPGVMSAGIIVNEAGFILFALLLFVYLYERVFSFYMYVLLILYMLLDGNFVYLFIALSIFSIYSKNRNFFILNIFLVIGSLSIYGIDMHGSPRGYFLESLGIYAAIFTPIIFIYLFYVLYRRYLTKDIDMLWFIATVTLLISLVLSFRQRIGLEYFAPYIILALPLIAQTFEHSYRVRLNIFRKNYKLMFLVSLTLLFINSSVVFLNKYLYLIVEEPKKHFSYNMHVAKELSKELKKREIYCVDTSTKMAKRLEFYGVTKCNNNILQENYLGESLSDNVTISYKNIVVYSAYVTKINTN